MPCALVSFQSCVLALHCSDRIEDDIRSYLGKDTGGFREAGLLLERKTELYEHQEISLAQIQERREKGIRTFLIVLPTAAGKSRIVEEDIQKFAAGKEQFRALILAPNTNIIADWKERIDKDLQPLQDRIDIKTYSYAIRHYHEKTRDYYSYIVVDEAHHIRNTETFAYKAVSRFVDNAEAVLFLTATPVQLEYADLFVRLNLLRPDYVIDKNAFHEMAEPNLFINQATMPVRGRGDGWQKEALEHS